MREVDPEQKPDEDPELPLVVRALGLDNLKDFHLIVDGLNSKEEIQDHDERED